MDGYKPFPYKGFGAGLNLRSGPDAVAEDEAIDALNVFHPVRNSVSQRSGYSKFTGVIGTNRYDSLATFLKTDGTEQIVAGAGNRLEAINTSGAVIASSSSPTTSPHFFQRFGGPTAEHLYIANGADTVRRWTGSAFETPAYVGTTPAGRFLGLSVNDNRLVNARFSGTTAGNNPSTVRFAAEGDPLTWGATHFVDLTPGDGEEIMGVVTWRDQVIVFKQTRFFVFFGTEPDDDGEPDFHYRTVDTGHGLAASQALAVTEQGVYFLDTYGIYFTSGAEPIRVSDDVEPIFQGTPSIYYTGGVLNHAAIGQATMISFDERLWLSFPADPGAANNRQLVFDPLAKWWALADLPAGPMVVFSPESSAELIFGYSSGSNLLGRYQEGVYGADDVGVIRHNLCTNPKAEVDLTGWSFGGFVVPAERVDLPVGGGPSLTGLPTGVADAFHGVGDTSGDHGRFNFNVVSGTIYRLSVYMWLQSNTSEGMALQILDQVGVSKGFAPTFATLGVWQRFDLQFVADGTDVWQLRVRQMGAGAADMYWTATLIEVGAVLDTYFDGDYVGATWLGTPEASVSSLFVPDSGGVAIAARWQGGWFTYGSPVVKTIRESKLSGLGVVTVSFYRDYRQIPGIVARRELSPPAGLYDSGLLYDSGELYGPTQVVQPKAVRKAIRGEAFSVGFSNDEINRLFTVHRLTTHVRESRVPSVVKVK